MGKGFNKRIFKNINISRSTYFIRFRLDYSAIYSEEVIAFQALDVNVAMAHS